MCRVRRKNTLSPVLTGPHIHFPIHTGLSPGSPAYGDYLSEYYYYCSGDDHIPLEERPLVGQELFARLTGCEFSRINE